MEEHARDWSQPSNEFRERIVWNSEIGRGIINLDSKVGKFTGSILIPALPNNRIHFFFCRSFIHTAHRLLYATVFNVNRIKQVY